MRDRLRFEAPLGPLGWFAEKFILHAYLTRFLRERDAMIKRIAESPAGEWQKYLQNVSFPS
jgi:hypothetical protein